MRERNEIMPGALEGIRIIEFAGIGPAPFCGMMLADHGAEVIRIERKSLPLRKKDPLLRSRRSLALDLKQQSAKDLVIKLVATADGIIEGFRPGVMENFGLGPDTLLKANEKLVYGRMTGWGQYGPYAQAAGHDINYIALSGVLHTCGRAGNKPTPPVNYLGDFGGGGMMLAFGMLAALLAVKNGASGQVIDCAMTDGSAALSSLIWGLKAEGLWHDKTGVNLLDSGAHFYDTYETSDGKYIAVGSIEYKFYKLLLEKAGLADEPGFDQQLDPSRWAELKEKVTAAFRTKTRDEWCAIMEMTDVCFAPVLSMDEAPQHPHNQERGTFFELDGFTQPAPAPRFSGTPAPSPEGVKDPGTDNDSILDELGLRDNEVEALKASGAI